MTGCMESGLALVRRELEETVERILPLVEELVQRFSPDEIVTTEPEEFGYQVSVPFRFTDGIGEARVVASLFRYRDVVRTDIELRHNRRLAKPDGSASDRRCFLNDFVASVSVPAGGTELPQEFRQKALRGAWRARNAVYEHNQKHPEPWNQVTVVAVD